LGGMTALATALTALALALALLIAVFRNRHP
jgi:hypothetical protein